MWVFRTKRRLFDRKLFTAVGNLCLPATNWPAYIHRMQYGKHICQNGKTGTFKIIESEYFSGASKEIGEVSERPAYCLAEAPRIYLSYVLCNHKGMRSEWVAQSFPPNEALIIWKIIHHMCLKEHIWGGDYQAGIWSGCPTYRVTLHTAGRTRN